MRGTGATLCFHFWYDRLNQMGDRCQFVGRSHRQDKLLCGFSGFEIAQALLAREVAIEKRLGRARKLFRQGGAQLEASQANTVCPLPSVVQQRKAQLAEVDWVSDRFNLDDFVVDDCEIEDTEQSTMPSHDDANDAIYERWARTLRAS